MREEVPYVTDLEDEEGEPGRELKMSHAERENCIPVKRGNHVIEGKWAWMSVVLMPNRVPMMLAILGFAIGVVDADNHAQEP